MVKLVPDNFVVPLRLDGNGYYARPLTIDDVDKDFDAVMANAARLRSPNPNSSEWPDNLTKRQNLVDLGWHEKEFSDRSSFTYTLFTDDEEFCLGSVYIYPTDAQEYDARIEMWARQDTPLGNIDDQLFALVKKWVADDWSFKNVAFVGTEISRTDWEKVA